jgi:hypothetical protein
MTKTHKQILLICMAVIVSSLWVQGYIIRSQAKTIPTLQQQITAARHINAPKTAQQEPAAARLHDARKKLLSRTAAFPMFTAYAVGLRTLMDRHRLSTEDSLVFMPARPPLPDLRQYHTTIRVRGTYPRIKQFMSDIINQQGLVYFTAMRFAKIPDAPDAVDLAMDLTMVFRLGDAYALE